MKILTTVFYWVATAVLVLCIVYMIGINVENMQAECEAVNGTFVKAADPTQNVCIIPPKR